MKQSSIRTTRMRTLIENPAVQQGLMWGVVLGVIEVLLAIISSFVNIGDSNIIASVVAMLAFLWAGIRAAQKTGLVRTGLMAGWLTGLIASIISSVVTVIITFIKIDSLRTADQKIADQLHLKIQYTNSLVLGGVIFYGTLLIVLAMIVGLAMGAIGGTIGKRRTKLPAQNYEEAMFQPPPTSPTEPIPPTESVPPTE